MDIKELLIELEKHTETSEFKEWNKSHNKGLCDKNDELLQKIVTGNAEKKTLNERIQAMETDLSKTNGDIKRVLLSKPLAEKLTNRGAFNVLIPKLVNDITETYGLQIKADGDDLEVMGMIKEGGNETGATIDQILDHWSKSDIAKECFKPETTTKSTSPDFKGGSESVDAEYTAARLAAGLPLEK